MIEAHLTDKPHNPKNSACLFFGVKTETNARALA
jgi:hypothetical protein